MSKKIGVPPGKGGLKREKDTFPPSLGHFQYLKETFGPEERFPPFFSPFPGRLLKGFEPFG